MRLIPIAAMITLSVLAYGNEKYKLALQYLDGTIGAKHITKKVPRCPYERCKGKKNYIYVQKDLKHGYKLLKEASADDFDASYKALTILLKQIDYKSDVYDEYLTHKLKEDYNLTSIQYNKDVFFFLNKLLKSNNNKYICYGSYNLYSIYHDGYLQLQKDNQKANKYKRIAVNKCSKGSYQYLILSNESGE